MTCVTIIRALTELAAVLTGSTPVTVPMGLLVLTVSLLFTYVNRIPVNMAHVWTYQRAIDATVQKAIRA